MTEPTPITFEDGYRRLQEIAEEVNRSEIPVDRLGDLFAEGKGLDRALTEYLAQQRARIERIERGEEIQAFRIVAPGVAPMPGATPADFDRTPPPPPRSPSLTDDDVPF